jgi:hypothetical protein
MILEVPPAAAPRHRAEKPVAREDGIAQPRLALPLVDHVVPIQSAKAYLLIKDKDPDKNDQLLWKWLKGQITLPESFGDPLNTDAYTLCIYDESAATPSVVFRATAPAGGLCGTKNPKPCWKALGKNPAGRKGEGKASAAHERGELSLQVSGGVCPRHFRRRARAGPGARLCLPSRSGLRDPRRTRASAASRVGRRSCRRSAV